MNTGRLATPGKTRSCPHCKATILESSSVCPGCHHHLRFDAAQRTQPTLTPLRVEGSIRHPPTGGAWEYCFVLAIRNARGEEIARQIVGVGAMQPNEERTFTLAVEVFEELREQKVVETKPAPREIKPTPPGPAPLPKDPRPPAGAAVAPALDPKLQPRLTPPPKLRDPRLGTPPLQDPRAQPPQPAPTPGTRAPFDPKLQPKDSK
jgi:hypothetical protein